MPDPDSLRPDAPPSRCAAPPRRELVALVGARVGLRSELAEHASVQGAQVASFVDRLQHRGGLEEVGEPVGQQIVGHEGSRGAAGGLNCNRGLRPHRSRRSAARRARHVRARGMCDRPLVNGRARSAPLDRPRSIGLARSARLDRPHAMGPTRSVSRDRPRAIGPVRSVSRERPPARSAPRERPRTIGTAGAAAARRGAPVPVSAVCRWRQAPEVAAPMRFGGPAGTSHRRAKPSQHALTKASMILP